MRPSSGTSIPRQPHVSGGRSNEMKLPSSARHEAPLLDTRLLCLPGLRSPYPTRQSSRKPHHHPGCPLPPSGRGVCGAARVPVPASRRWGSLLPLLPLQPAPRPFYRPPFLSPAFDSRSRSAARAVGDPHCTSRRSILLALRLQLLLAGRRTLRLPASLFPSDCQRAPPVPTPAAHSRLTPSVTFPGGGRLGTRGFIPCAAARLREALAPAPTLSS